MKLIDITPEVLDQMERTANLATSTNKDTTGLALIIAIPPANVLSLVEHVRKLEAALAAATDPYEANDVTRAQLRRAFKIRSSS